MAKWFGAHYNQEVRFSSSVECKKGPHVLTSVLNQRQNYYYYISVRSFLEHPDYSGESISVFVRIRKDRYIDPNINFV